MNRDDFTQKTKDILAKRVACRCSNPECNRITLGPHTKGDKYTSIGVAAHITAASKDGPRYNPLLTSEQRKSSLNGIWLCQDCAKLIDSDIDKFPEQLLFKWKEVSESKVFHEISNPNTESKDNPSLDDVKVIDIQGFNTNDGQAYILDFRVQNYSNKQVLINKIKFTSIANAKLMLLGAAEFSSVYHFDLKKLNKVGNSDYCNIAQILNPSEIDRFAVILSYSEVSGAIQGWELYIELETNVGLLKGKVVDFWLAKGMDYKFPVDISVRHFKKNLRYLISYRQNEFKKAKKIDPKSIDLPFIGYFLMFIFPKYIMLTVPNFRGCFNTIFYDLAYAIAFYSTKIFKRKYYKKNKN